MAVTIAEANAVSSPNYDRNLVQQVYEACIVLQLLNDRKRVRTGGTDQRFPIRYRKLGQADAVGPREQIEYRSRETRTSLPVQWRFYENHTVMHWDERVANDGRAKVIDLTADKAEELEEDYRDKIGLDIYAANAKGIGIDPLTTLVSDGEYQGVNEDDFKSTVDTGTTALEMYGQNSVSALFNKASFGRMGPTHILTTRDLHSDFESKWVKLQRFLTRSQRMLRLGFDGAFMFRGASVIADPYMPDKNMMLLDLDSIGCFFHPGSPNVSKWEPMIQAGFPEALMKVLTAVLNLYITRRRTSARFTALEAAPASSP